MAATQQKEIKRSKQAQEQDARAVGRPKIRVVGVGGGGCNAVSRMYRDRVPEVVYISVNTDAQALAHCPTPDRIRVGDATARGLGVGGNPEKGRLCHEEDRETIRQHLEGADLVFIAAGMGGGTGTGGAPVVADVAREVGALTVGVVTKPFSFEGTRRGRQAKQGIERMAEFVDTIIVIPNDRLLAVSEEKLSLDAAFRLADDVLNQGIQSIAELILTPGEINLDFADVKSVMSNAGQAWMAIGRGHGPQRAINAARAAIESPLLEVSVEGAKGVIFNITGGENLSLDEVQETSEYISQIVSPSAHIFFGTSMDPKMEDEVRLTVIATGFPFDDTSCEAHPVNKRALDSLMDDDSKRDLPPFMRNKAKKRNAAPAEEAAAEPEATAEAAEATEPEQAEQHAEQPEAAAEAEAPQDTAADTEAEPAAEEQPETA